MIKNNSIHSRYPYMSIKILDKNVKNVVTLV